MKKQQSDELLKKYEAGLTSLSEEEQLREAAEDLEGADRTWFSFLKKNKATIPTDLDVLLQQQMRKQQRSIRLRQFTTVAASLVLFFSAWIFLKMHQNQQEQIRKEALLQEAISMVSDSEENSAKTVLYQDEYVIIYTK